MIEHVDRNQQHSHHCYLGGLHKLAMQQTVHHLKQLYFVGLQPGQSQVVGWGHLDQCHIAVDESLVSGPLPCRVCWTKSCMGEHPLAVLML